MINHIYGVVNTKCKNFLLFLPVIFDTYASFCTLPRLAGGAHLAGEASGVFVYG